MKTSKLFILFIAFALGVALSPAGYARGGGGHGGGHSGGAHMHVHGHGHAHVGVFVGGPFWYPAPYYYYPPYYPYYYPPVASAPPTYIEQGSQQNMASGYWYYCGASNAYYPYVKECPGGWQQVAPRPAQ